MSEFKDVFRDLLSLAAGLNRDRWDLRPHEIELTERMKAAPSKLIELLEAHKGQRLDLRGASLSGFSLSGMDLSNADMTGADLEFSDLYGTDLSNADLTDAGLRNARFDDETRWPPYFDFRMCGAIGPGAICRGYQADSVEYLPANLACADLTGARLIAIELQEGDLRSTRLCGASVTGAEFIEVDMRGADFREADLRHTVFIACDLRGADFRGAKNLWSFDGCRTDENTRWDDEEDEISELPED